MKAQKLIHLALVLACFLPSLIVSAQILDPNMNGGNVFPKAHSAGKIPVPLYHLREADVMWSKKVWRRIDLRQKFNYPYYYPVSPIENRKSLFEVLKRGIIEYGSIIAYDPGPLGDNDDFTIPLSAEQVNHILVSYDTIPSENPITGEMDLIPVKTEISSADVMMYEVKEQWFFDKQRSTMGVRIIGICPIIEKRDELTGDIRGTMRLFWVYFPEARYELVNEEAFNRFNGVKLTYDDMFTKRMFDSYIIKEDNIYDRTIGEYKAGLDALLEAEKIKENIFNYEQDLWFY